MLLLLQNDQILHLLPIYVQFSPYIKKSQLSHSYISGLCGPSIPFPLYLYPHPHIQSQSYHQQSCISPAFLSQGANLHNRDELSYCVDSTACLLQERAGLSVDIGIMQWPGFRGQLTCLKSISRNISLVDCPFCCAEGPLTASPSTSVQSILLHFHSLYGQNISF